MSAIATTSSSFSKDLGYGFGFGSGDTSRTVYGTDLVKRQTCTLVYATLNGDVVSWCNNWGGSTVVERTSFSTTCKKTCDTSLWILPFSVQVLPYLLVLLSIN
jgi:hypothetical protein